MKSMSVSKKFIVAMENKAIDIKQSVNHITIPL